MRHPGVEPGPPRWQREIITARLMTLLRHLQDSNLRGRSPVDFESTALTTRPRCPPSVPKEVENPGFDPGASCLQSTHSTD